MSKITSKYKTAMITNLLGSTPDELPSWTDFGAIYYPARLFPFLSRTAGYLSRRCLKHPVPGHPTSQFPATRAEGERVFLHAAYRTSPAHSFIDD